MTPQHYDPTAARSQAKSFFEELWADGDPWALDASPLDQERYREQLAMVDGRRYRRVLEIGCAAGAFTERLVPIADSIVAIDIAAPAIERATARLSGAPVTFRLLDTMDLDPADDGPWDLIVIAEVIYYLGWLHPMFNVAWLLHALYDATTPGGRLLVADTIGDDNGIMSRWLIRTYRDLARNVGYELDRGHSFDGTKNGVTFEISLDLFTKACC